VAAVHKSEMSPVLMVITHVLIQQPSQMFSIQHDHMIQEIIRASVEMLSQAITPPWL